MSMSFWLMMGFFFSAILGLLVPASFVNKHLAEEGWSSVWKASLFGVPLPLCSCSVIPTGLGLLKRGASKAATMSFITSTPQTGVESFMLAGGALGWPFALVKAIFAFLMGVLVGGLLPKSSEDQKKVNSIAEPKKSIKEMLEFGFIELPSTLFRPYIIGLAVSACLMSWVDPGSISELIGVGWLESFAVLAFSVPLYLCATSSIPLGIALLHQGVSLGGVAVFLIAGPATNLISLLMINKIMGRKVTAVYLSVIILGSLVLSFMINTVLSNTDGMRDVLHDHDSVGWFQQLCGVILLMMFLMKFVPKGKNSQALTCGEVGLQLSGLTCGGCVSKLNQALGEKGIEAKLLTTTYIQIQKSEEDDVKAIVTECGFRYEDNEKSHCCS